MTLLPVLLFALLKQCPPQESIAPCRCSSGYSLDVTCSRLQTDSQLLRVLKQLKGHGVSKLTISDLSASTWKTDLFEGLHIKSLSLENIEVDDPSFRPGLRHFKGLEHSLEGLDITKSFREGHSLVNLKLDHLSELSVVILEGNHIPEVGNDWFTAGPTGLHILLLERNGIEVLGNRAFTALNQLVLLAVAGNHLTEISRSALPRPAAQLTGLDLANNKLRNLPSDLFSDMPSLVDVNLENNLIHVLREDTFSDVISRLGALSLKGNPLECDDRLQWVCKSNPHVISGKCTGSGEPVRQFCRL